MSDYEDRLAAVEAEFAELEPKYRDLQAKMAKVLRERPCDFALMKPGRGFWIRYRTPQGARFASVQPFNESIHRFEAERQLDWMDDDSIKIVELPRK